EHFLPQFRNPQHAAEYENLFYTCRVCNLRKAKATVPDPGVTLTSESIRVYPDGTLAGLTLDAKRIIRLLCLNSPAMTRWRRTWSRITELAAEHDGELFHELMRYPRDIPDLRSCRAPANIRPQGIAESFFARQERGELADTYLY